MIIKSMSRQGGISKLVKYMKKPLKAQKNQTENIFWNFETKRPNNTKAVIKEFLENQSHIKARKNGVAYYHEVISFNALDSQKLTTKILLDIAKKYLSLRAESSLAFAVPHFENGKNPHIHIAISANECGSSKKAWIKKAQFQKIKQELEQYQREKYPELECSLVNHGTRSQAKPQISRKEKELKRRCRKGQKQTEKEKLAELVSKYLKFSTSEAEFRTQINLEGLCIYQRGHSPGIEDLSTSRRHRLKTLGIQVEYEQAQARWLRTMQRATELETLQVEKGRQIWREQRFKEDIDQVLAGTSNSARHQQLNALLKKKRRCHRQPGQHLEINF